MQIEVGKLNSNVHKFTNLDFMDPIYRCDFDNGFQVSTYHVCFVEFVSLPQNILELKNTKVILYVAGRLEDLSSVVMTMFLISHSNNKSHVRSVREESF